MNIDMRVIDYVKEVSDYIEILDGIRIIVF